MNGKLVRSLFRLCLLFLLLPGLSQAMPNFARKYQKGCNMCHTEVPKLNRTGFEFRAAGYRLPDEIGQKEGEFNLADYFVGRIQVQDEDRSKSQANGSKPLNPPSGNQFTFFEATLYPMTGSWGQYFGSLVELSMAPGQGFEVENAFVRGVWGDATNGWFTGRVGIMHPNEGFGAADRPLGNNRPLFQKQNAIGNPFYLWNIDEMAAEVGYYWPKFGTNVSARISNGIIWKADPRLGNDHADPAQGGDLLKAQNQVDSTHKNWQVVLNQYVTKDSGFNLYYYRGQIPFPDTTEPSNTVFTSDTFSRLAVYANWYVLPKQLNVLGGWFRGWDSLGNPKINGLITALPDAAPTSVKGSQVGDSKGVFGEADYELIQATLAFGARYDYFNPSKNAIRVTQRDESVFVNYKPTNFLQLIGDYTHKSTEAGATRGDNRDNQLLLRAILIF